MGGKKTEPTSVRGKTCLWEGLLRVKTKFRNSHGGEKFVLYK